MYDGPVREGTRGGAGDFRWSAVKDDKHRENYLGHTIQAPVGRWQNNKDIHWYSRDKEPTGDAAAQAKREEIRQLKEAEDEALNVALGFAPKQKAEGAEGAGSGANAIKVEGSRAEEIERLEKEEQKREKALRKEQRALARAEREVRREERYKEKDERRAVKHEVRYRDENDHRPRERYREEDGRGDGRRERMDERDTHHGGHERDPRRRDGDRRDDPVRRAERSRSRERYRDDKDRARERDRSPLGRRRDRDDRSLTPPVKRERGDSPRR